MKFERKKLVCSCCLKEDLQTIYSILNVNFFHCQSCKKFNISEDKNNFKCFNEEITLKLNKENLFQYTLQIIDFLNSSSYENKSPLQCCKLQNWPLPPAGKLIINNVCDKCMQVKINYSNNISKWYKIAANGDLLIDFAELALICEKEC